MVSPSDSMILKLWLNSQSSPHTRSCYRRDANLLIEKLRKPLAQMDLGDLQEFADSLIAAGLAPVSRLRTIAAVRSLFAFCLRMGYLPSNPAAELPLPKYDNRLAERIAPQEAIQRLLAADMGDRDRVLLQVLYTAGLRVSEACGLRWRNLRAVGDAGQITVYGKGGRTRSIALPKNLWIELNKLRKTAGNEEPVFPSKSGKPLDRGRVRVILRKAAEVAGVSDKTPGISPHWLRHAHASHALDAGAPVHLVASTLGHRSIATTTAYLHSRPTESSARFLNLGAGNRSSKNATAS